MTLQLGLPLYSGQSTAQLPGIHRSRRLQSATHCPRGHEYATTGGYVYYNADGSIRSRNCKPCTIERVYERRARLGRRLAS